MIPITRGRRLERERLETEKIIERKRKELARRMRQEQRKVDVRLKESSKHSALIDAAGLSQMGSEMPKRGAVVFDILFKRRLLVARLRWISRLV